MAEKPADAPADHGRFKSHYRHIDRNTATDLGLGAGSLEDDPPLRDPVLSVFHATVITFRAGPVKIIESNAGKTFIKQQPAPPFRAPPQGASRS